MKLTSKTIRSLVHQLDPTDPTQFNLYEPLQGDPGPSINDNFPFSIDLGERLRFGSTVARFKYRTTDGFFVFEPEDASAPFLRSSWRIKEEFNRGIIDRIDRIPPAAGNDNQRILQEADVEFLQKNSTCFFKASAVKNQAYFEAILLEESRRKENGLEPLNRTGPRSKGGLAEPHFPPRNLAELIANVAKEIEDTSRPSWKTLAKKLAPFKNYDHLTLYDAGDKRGIRQSPSRLDDDVESIIDHVFEARLKQKDGASVDNLMRHITDAVESANNGSLTDEKLVAPSRTAIEKRLRAISGMQLMARTQGRGRSTFFYRQTGKFERPSAPFLEVEFDWTLCQIWLRPDDLTGSNAKSKSAVKVWKGTFVDRYSSQVIATFLSFREPSTEQFFMAIRHLITPASKYDPDSFISFRTGKLRGVPSKLIMDRGPELLSDATVESLRKIGMAICWVSPRSGHKKPYVESLHNAENQELLRYLPGSYSKKDRAAATTAPNSKELLSVSEFIAKIEDYYFEFRNNKRGSTSSASPNRILADYMLRNKSWCPGQPSSMDSLDKILTIPLNVKATDEGVLYKRIRWNSDFVSKIRSDLQAHLHGNPTVRIFLRPHDLSSVYVEHPATGERKLIPSTMSKYTDGLDFFRHKRNLRLAREMKQADDETDEPFLARVFVKLTSEAKETIKEGRTSTRDASRILNLTANGKMVGGTDSSSFYDSERELLPGAAIERDENFPPANDNSLKDSLEHAGKRTNIPDDLDDMNIEDASALLKRFAAGSEDEK